MRRIIASFLVCVLAGCSVQHTPLQAPAEHATHSAHTDGPGIPNAPIDLGRFSISLNVKNIAASREFYEKLGFRVVSGNQSQNWLVMDNQTSTISLFQGMYDRNMLTYSPGWDRNRATLTDFEDVRAIQRELKHRGLVPKEEADEKTTGPAGVMLVDPDGNPIYIVQFVPKPTR